MFVAELPPPPPEEASLPLKERIINTLLLIDALEYKLVTNSISEEEYEKIRKEIIDKNKHLTSDENFIFVFVGPQSIRNAEDKLNEGIVKLEKLRNVLLKKSLRKAVVDKLLSDYNDVVKKTIEPLSKYYDFLKRRFITYRDVVKEGIEKAGLIEEKVKGDEAEETVFDVIRYKQMAINARRCAFAYFIRAFDNVFYMEDREDSYNIDLVKIKRRIEELAVDLEVVSVKIDIEGELPELISRRDAIEKELSYLEKEKEKYRVKELFLDEEKMSVFENQVKDFKKKIDDLKQHVLNEDNYKLISEIIDKKLDVVKMVEEINKLSIKLLEKASPSE